MLEISDRAMAIIEEVRVLSGAGDDEAIVLFHQDGGVGFAVRAAGDGDQVFTRDGRALVVLAADLVDRFDGWMLDFKPAGDHGAFTLRRP